MLETINGNYFVEFDENSTLHQNGIFSFEFIPKFEGNYTLLPMVIDSFGVQKFSTETIHMEVRETSTASPSVSMVYPSSDITISDFSTTRFVVNANHNDGSLLGVQFYINGEKYGEMLPYQKDKPKDSSFYTLDYNPPFAKDINFITASAIDTIGNESFSPAIVVKISPGDSNIPIINLDPVNESYSEEQSLFLSASVSDFADSASGTGVVEEVSFIINGQVARTFTQKPYFWIWDPMETGAYNIFVTARDNEGNVAVSHVENTLIGFDFTGNIQVPKLGTTYPKVPGEVKFDEEVSLIETSASQRRNSDTNIVEKFTVIKGLSTSFLNQLSIGQIIRFSNGETSTTKNYEVFKITDNNELQLKGLLSDSDKLLLGNWSNLELINVYRAGSIIPLYLKSNVNDDELTAVSFYVDAFLVNEIPHGLFSSYFAPSAEGNYTVAVIAENSNGSQTIYTERLEVSPKVGLIPDGTTTIYPDLTTRGFTSIGSELVLLANFEDADRGMNRVEFYLNGELAHIDREKPYYFKFKPFSDASVRQQEKEWEVYAVGIDNDQNRRALLESGEVQSSILLPKATIKFPTNNSEYSHEQSIKIRIDVTGSYLERLLGRSSDVLNPNINLTPRQMNILANGEFISAAQETAWGTGIFMTDWICDKNFAGDSGEIEIMGAIVMEDNLVNGSPFTPSILSNIVKIKIGEIDPSDPKAAVNQTIIDFTGKSANEQEVNTAVSDINNDQSTYLFENEDFLRWASHLSEREIFQNMIDAIAGFHIMTGLFPDYLKIQEIMDTYSAIPNYGQDGSIDEDGDGFSLRQENLFLTSDQDPSDFPSSAFSMGSFVDDILSSSDYTDIHGEVPPLTPPPNSADRFTNYEKNRRDFVRIIYQNKYGTRPTIQQEVQGSYRIKVFDPSSVEARRDQQLMMMQQLSMFSNFGFGGAGAGRPGGGAGANVNPFASLLGNTNQDSQLSTPTFRNGEPAVLFVVNMIAEETINNLDMIWGAPSKRSYYKTGALISSLWQENTGVMSDELISTFYGLSTEHILSQLMRDSRYLDRFGGLSIIRQAEKLDALPGWKYLDWLGYFNDEKFPWIYHSALGWIYVHGPKEDVVWLYISEIGWFWTTKDIWSNRNPDWILWLYEQDNSRWVGYYHYEPIGKELISKGKTFWDPQSQKDFVYE